MIGFLEGNPIWGVADEIAGTEIDLSERDLQRCFGDTKEQRDAYLGLRSRLREQKSIEAMRGLVLHLDGYRESRKAVIAVTQGWRLFTENQARMTDEGTNDPGRAAGRCRLRRWARQAGSGRPSAGSTVRCARTSACRDRWRTAATCSAI